MTTRANYSLNSPSARYVAVGICTTAVLGCSIAYWYRARRLPLTASPPVTAVKKAYKRTLAAVSGIVPLLYPRVRSGCELKLK